MTGSTSGVGTRSTALAVLKGTAPTSFLLIVAGLLGCRTLTVYVERGEGTWDDGNRINAKTEETRVGAAFQPWREIALLFEDDPVEDRRVVPSPAPSDLGTLASGTPPQPSGIPPNPSGSAPWWAAWLERVLVLMLGIGGTMGTQRYVKSRSDPE